MTLSTALFSLILALTLGAISPGPSFVMVARTALAVSRRDGIAASFGMGVGGALFALVAVLGLLAVLAAVPLLYLALKLLGGAYLVYLGVRIWRGAAQPLALSVTEPAARQETVMRSFALGLVTQVSNPKTAIVYAGVFASLLPADAPTWVLVALPPIVFLIETGWYSLVSLALSSPAPRARYLASKAWLDRAAGGILALLGFKLVVDAVRP